LPTKKLVFARVTLMLWELLELLIEIAYLISVEKEIHAII